jgi:outer membrane protein
MKKILTTCFILIFPFAGASADTLGLYVGGGSWSHDPSGNFSSTQTGSSTIDVKSDLNMSKKSESYVWMAFEHPVPLLPNIRLERSSLTNTGNTGNTFNFNDQTNVTGNYEVTLKSTDLVLYYRLLDNWVNLDLGIDARKIDGTFALGTNNSRSVSATVPMLYAAAEFDLPLPGLSVGADYKVVSYSGSTYNDMRIRAAYEFGVVGIEAGIRSTKIKISDVDNINTDLTFKGVMVGAFLHF